ncbi:MAG: hypothetical protein NZ528_06505 [Caldilineales bacterium]|nr:hypothetical protein [Caldilineales bacterium]
MSHLWLRRLLLVALVLSLAACSNRERGKIKGEDASPDALPDLVGTYVVNGLDPLGTEYGGTLAISAGEQPGTYRLVWVVTGSLQEGLGRVEGNRLLVEWQTTQAMEITSRGVATYTITTLGELYGQRKVLGADAVGTENAFPNPKP